MKIIKYLWDALLSLFSGLFTSLIDKEKINKKVIISKTENAKINGNRSNTNLTIKNVKDSEINDNIFM